MTSPIGSTYGAIYIVWHRRLVQSMLALFNTERWFNFDMTNKDKRMGIQFEGCVFMLMGVLGMIAALVGAGRLVNGSYAVETQL
jgi:hypothetical protein